MGVLVLNHRLADVLDGGFYRCAGVVDELGVAGRYEVALINKRTGRRVQVVWSGLDGAYQFDGIANKSADFFVCAFDRGADPVNAAISDQLVLEPMP